MTQSDNLLVDAMRPKAKSGLPVSRMIGLGLMGLLAVAAIGGPGLIGKDPSDQSLLNALQGPSPTHPLGTDNLGRDMAARLLSGAQLSLSLAFLSVLTAGLPGTILGVVAAWFGGWPTVFWGPLPMRFWHCPGCCWSLCLRRSLRGRGGHCMQGYR